MSHESSNPDPRVRLSQLLRLLLSAGDVPDVFSDIPEEVLERFLTGQASESDHAELKSAADQNPDLAQVFAALEAAESEGDAPLGEVDLPLFHPLPLLRAGKTDVDWGAEWGKCAAQLAQYSPWPRPVPPKPVPIPSPPPFPWKTVLAACVPLFLGVAFYVHAQAEDLKDLQRENQVLQLGYQELLGKLQSSGAARGVPEDPKAAFSEEFEKNMWFQPRTYPNEPKLGLVFNPFLGPPYFAGVRATWDEGDKWIYLPGQVPLVPEVFLDFSNLPVISGERRITLVLEFHPTGQAMEAIDGLTPKIQKTIPLILSPEGVRVASPDEQRMVTASILSPSNGAGVEDQFVFQMGLQHPMLDGETGLNRMVHVLVHPLDGDPLWREQYFVVPFQKRVDALPLDRETQTLTIPLKSYLEMIPLEPSPTRFEILVVDVPFQLENWSVGKNVLDFDSQAAESMVRARIVVTRQATDEDEI